MTRKDDRSDADRIALGLDPLQGERLYDLDDLWRVLERLGHEPGDRIPTTVWDYADWTCPLDDCDGGLELADTRVRGLPPDTEDLDQSVDRDDSELYLRLNEAQSPTVPVVTCYECQSVFEASFRRLRNPEEERLPEPRIVETPGTLSGRPRIDGTRIGVEHVWAFHERGDSADDIAKQQYPPLSEAHVNAAIEWAQEHPDRMAAMRREDEELRLRHDILQSAVDAGVAECIEKLWPALVNVRSQDADALRPVASLLRNGFERADGLDITIDADERRITIDVADEVVARLHDFEDGSPPDDVETATADRKDWADSTPTDAGESLFGGDRDDGE
jgi:uncharacterized protein (DUF433 family)